MDQIFMEGLSEEAIFELRSMKRLTLNIQGEAFQAKKEVHAKALRLPKALAWGSERCLLRTSGNCDRVTQAKEQLEVTEHLTSDILALLGLLFGG